MQVKEEVGQEGTKYIRAWGYLVCRSCGSFTIRTRNSKAVGGLWPLLQGYLIIHPADHLAEESTMPNPHLNQLI
jgi:hypothetical protein